MMRLAACSLALAAALTLGRPSFAQAEVSGASRLAVSWPVDSAVALGAGGLWIGSELLKRHLAPQACRWCARNALDDSVTRALGWRDAERASLIGDLMAAAAMPALATGAWIAIGISEDRVRDLPEDGLLVLESTTVAALLSQMIKLTVGRERPLVAELREGDKGDTARPADNNLSFYSQHSTCVFAMAVSAGTVAHLRGYRAEPLVWAVGLTMATFVAYSRIAAKKHYLTDVLAGAALGAAAGVAVPLLHRTRRSAPGVAVAVAPGGLSFSGTF